MQRILAGLAGFFATSYFLTLMIYLILRYTLGDSLWWLSLANTFAHFLFLPLLILLPLALIARSRRALVTLLPVLLLAVIWFVPYHIPRQTVLAAGETTLTVATANLWARDAAFDTIERLMGEADVLALQEITQSYVDDRLPALLETTAYHRSPFDQSHRGHNLTLSRYPIVEASHLALGHPEYTWALRTVIDVEGQPVAVYNVHFMLPMHVGDGLRGRLASGQGPLFARLVLGFDDRIRNEQIANLLAHLQTEPYPYVVAGDFNMSDQSMTYQRVAATMTDAYRAAGAGFHGSWPVAVVRGLPAFVPPLLRIDYIWHSDGLHTLDAHTGDATGSDHLPVLATLALG